MSVAKVMSWPRQVLHVAQKDIRAARWTVFAYVVVAVVITSSAARWPHDSWDDLGVLVKLLAVFGMIAAALFVQTDSASRVDAYWATRPLSPSAVVAAKVVVIFAAVLLPAAVGMTVALATFDFPLRDGVRLMLSHGAEYAWYLAIAAAIAALTPDLRTFVLGVVVFFIGAGVEQALLGAAHVSAAIPELLQDAIGLFICGAVLVHQYRRRDTRRGRGIAIGAGVIVVAAAASPQPASPGADASSSRLTGLAITEARLDARSTPNYLILHITAPDSSSRERIVLQSAHVLLRRSGGRTDTISTGNGFVRLNYPRLLATERLRWRPNRDVAGPPARDTSVLILARSQAGLTFILSAEQSAAVARGEVRVELEGIVEYCRSLPPANLSLRAGAAVSVNGRRFQYVERSETRTAPLVWIRDAVLDGAPIDSKLADLALVNPVVGEALPMDAGISTATTPGSPVPGLTVSESNELYLMPWNWTAQPTGVGFPGAAWMRDARLEIIGWRTTRSHPAGAVLNPSMLKMER